MPLSEIKKKKATGREAGGRGIVVCGSQQQFWRCLNRMHLLEITGTQNPPLLKGEKRMNRQKGPHRRNGFAGKHSVKDKARTALPEWEKKTRRKGSGGGGL